jgi:hypothetical protein
MVFTNYKIKLWTIPLVVILLLLFGVWLRGPYYLAENQDPAYLYLFNSLNVAHGIAAGHTDHPGAVLQIVGAVFLSLFHFIPWNGGMAALVLNHSEFFLKTLHILLILFHGLSLFVLGQAIYQKNKNLILAILMQLLALVIVPQSFFILSRFSAESLLAPICLLWVSVFWAVPQKVNRFFDFFMKFFISAGVFFLVWHVFIAKSILISLIRSSLSLFPLSIWLVVGLLIGVFAGIFKLLTFLQFSISSQKTKLKFKSKKLSLSFNERTFWLAFLSSAGLATKITFLPLIFVPVFFLKTYERKAWLFSTLIFGVIWLAPPFSFIGFYHFISGLFLHSGQYGTGEASVINFSTYFVNLKNILIAYPQTLFALILLVSLPIVKKPSKKSMAIFVAVVLGLLMVAKHNYGAQYLLPTMALSLLGYEDALTSISKKFFSWLCFCLGIVIVFQFLFFSWKIFPLVRTELKQLTDNKKFENITWIYSYPASAKPYALFFGNIYVFNSYSDLLAKTYPQD